MVLTFEISALGWLRQKHLEFKARLDYVARPRLKNMKEEKDKGREGQEWRLQDWQPMSPWAGNVTRA